MSLTNRRHGVPTAARTTATAAPAPVEASEPKETETAPASASATALPPLPAERVLVAPMTTIMSAPITTIAKSTRFRVHKHGGLRHDGMYFGPGEELPLSADEIKAYGIKCAEEFEG